MKQSTELKVTRNNYIALYVPFYNKEIQTQIEQGDRDPQGTLALMIDYLHTLEGNFNNFSAGGAWGIDSEEAFNAVLQSEIFQAEKMLEAIDAISRYKCTQNLYLIFGSDIKDCVVKTSIHDQGSEFPHKLYNTRPGYSSTLSVLDSEFAHYRRLEAPKYMDPVDSLTSRQKLRVLYDMSKGQIKDQDPTITVHDRILSRSDFELTKFRMNKFMHGRDPKHESKLTGEGDPVPVQPDSAQPRFVQIKGLKGRASLNGSKGVIDMTRGDGGVVAGKNGEPRYKVIITNEQKKTETVLLKKEYIVFMRSKPREAAGPRTSLFSIGEDSKTPESPEDDVACKLAKGGR